MVKEVILSLGSNLENREELLRQARESLSDELGEITAVSAVYETQAWGFDSFDFLNQVVALETEMPPMALLEKIQEIERNLGRVKKTSDYRNSENRMYRARPIDIDILIYENETIDSEMLTIPHARIAERKFVLIPLAELFPSRIIRKFGKSFREMLNECNDNSYIKKWE